MAKNLYSNIELNDESLVNIFFKNDRVNRIMILQKWLNERQHIKKYLDSRYSDIPDNDFSYAEVLYRMKDHIEQRPVCLKCGKPVKYINMGKFTLVCSMECFNTCLELTLKRRMGTFISRRSPILKYRNTKKEKTNSN